MTIRIKILFLLRLYAHPFQYLLSMTLSLQKLRPKLEMSMRRRTAKVSGQGTHSEEKMPPALLATMRK